MSEEWMQDLSKLLKEEGSLVKELTAVAVKAAKLHARLESIEKSLESAPEAYSHVDAERLAKQAGDKYAGELEKQMKEQARGRLWEN